MEITVLGEYDEKRNTITASNIMLKSIDKPYIEPVYHTTSGISSKLISNLINNCLETHPEVIDYIPEYLVQQYDYPDKQTSTYLIHNPGRSFPLCQKSIERAKYEELFRFMFKINYLKILVEQKSMDFREPSKRTSFENSSRLSLLNSQKINNRQ